MSHLVDHNDLDFALKRYPNIIGWVPDVRGHRGKINPHLSRFYTKDGAYIDVFHTKPIYYETISRHWRPLSEITHYHGNKNIILNPIASLKAHPTYLKWLEKRCSLLGGSLTHGNVLSPYMNELMVAFPGLTTTTVYPDPSPETTTVDGCVAHNNNSTSVWATVHGSANGTAINDTGAEINQGFVGTASVGKRGTANWGIERGMTGFDTSAVGSDTIDSGTVSLYVVSVTNNVDSGNDTFFPTEATPASNTALAVGDYDAIGDSVGAPTAWSTPVDLSALTSSAYNDYTLNATGEAGINGSGVTNIGWRLGDDVTSAPSFSNAQYNGANCRAADYTGTSQDPKLVVVHTAAATFTPKVMFF